MTSENGLSFSHEAFGEHQLAVRNYDQLDREAGDLALLASVPCEHPQDLMPARDARTFFALEDERRRISNFLLTLTTESERGEETSIGTVVYDENRMLEIYGSQAELATVFSRQRGLLARHEQSQSHLAQKIDVYEFQHCGAVLTSFGGRNLMDFESSRPNDDNVTGDFLNHVVASLLLRHREALPDFEFDNQLSVLFPEIMKTHLENLSIITSTVIGGVENVHANGSKNKVISQHANRLGKAFGRLQRSSRSALLSEGKHSEVCHAVSQILSHKSVPKEYVVPAFVTDTHEMIDFYRDLSYLSDDCEDCCASEIQSAIEEIVLKGEERGALFVPHEMNSFFAEETDYEIDEAEVKELFSRVQNAFDEKDCFEMHVQHESMNMFSRSVSQIVVEQGKGDRYFLKFEFDEDEHIELCISVSDSSIDWNCLEEFSFSKHAIPLIKAALDVLSDFATEDVEEMLLDESENTETVYQVRPTRQKRNSNKRGYRTQGSKEKRRRRPKSILERTLESEPDYETVSEVYNRVTIVEPRFPRRFEKMMERFSDHDKNQIRETIEKTQEDEPNLWNTERIKQRVVKKGKPRSWQSWVRSDTHRRNLRILYRKVGVEDGKIVLQPFFVGTKDEVDKKFRGR